MPGRRPAMMVHLVKRLPMWHGGRQRVVLQQKAERSDAKLAREGNDSRQHVHIAKLRRAHVRKIQRRVLVEFHVRHRIISSVKSRGCHSGPMRLVRIGEGKQRVHPGAVLHIVKQRVQVSLRERGHADGHCHHCGRRFGCSRDVLARHGLHAGQRRTGAHDTEFDEMTSVHAASIPRRRPDSSANFQSCEQPSIVFHQAAPRWFRLVASRPFLASPHIPAGDHPSI